jgi:uncharacterized protein YecA (UPF0149 family)
MARERISDGHKAIIEGHLALSPGIPIDVVHRELEEIFRLKGKYSLPQIAAVTSWLRSTALQNRRVAPPSPVEADTTSEDIDYNTPAKIASREWHFQNLVTHTTEEQRRTMKLLLMPGRNTFDIESALGIGVQPEHLVTYIRGDTPAANAEYLRNARQFGITHRRIGDMDAMLPDETEYLQAAYLDFFGQFCPAYMRMLYKLPVDPNGSVCVGVNLMEGREHGETGKLLQAISHWNNNMAEMAGEQDEWVRHRHMNDTMRQGAKNTGNVREARESTLKSMLFTGIGVANTREWLMKEEIKKLVQCYGEYPEFDDLDPYDQFEAVNLVMEQAMAIFYGTQKMLQKNGTPVDLPFLGVSTRVAMVNSPQVQKIIGPYRYVSPNGNRPFISYFGVLQGRKKHFEQWESAMRYFLAVATDALPRAKHQQPMGYFSSRRNGHTALLQYFTPDDRFVAEHSVDVLNEAAYELAKYHSDPTVHGVSQEQWQLATERIVNKTVRTELIALLELLASEDEQLPNMQPIRNRMLTGGKNRNKPCGCGSGKKFKKCCGTQ